MPNKPSSLEEAARDRAKKAIDEFVKNKKFPVPKIVLLALRPFLPAMREVWINGFLDGFGLGTSETIENAIDEIYPPEDS